MSEREEEIEESERWEEPVRTLGPEAWARFQELLRRPPAPTPALRKLMQEEVARNPTPTEEGG